MFSHTVVVGKRLDQLLGRAYQVDFMDEKFMDGLQVNMLYEFKAKMRERVYKRIGKQDDRDKMMDASGYGITKMDQEYEHRGKHHKKLRLLKQIMPIISPGIERETYQTELQREQARKDLLACCALIEKEPEKSELQKEMEAKIRNVGSIYAKYKIPLLYEMDDDKMNAELYSLADRVAWRRDLLENKVFDKRILEEISGTQPQEGETTEEPGELLESESSGNSEYQSSVSTTLSGIADSGKPPRSATKNGDSKQQQGLVEGNSILKPAEKQEEEKIEQSQEVQDKNSKGSRTVEKDTRKESEELLVDTEQKKSCEGVTLKEGKVSVERISEMEAHADYPKPSIIRKSGISNEQDGHIEVQRKSKLTGIQGLEPSGEKDDSRKEEEYQTGQYQEIEDHQPRLQILNKGEKKESFKRLSKQKMPRVTEESVQMDDKRKMESNEKPQIEGYLADTLGEVKETVRSLSETEKGRAQVTQLYGTEEKSEETSFAGVKERESQQQQFEAKTEQTFSSDLTPDDECASNYYISNEEINIIRKKAEEFPEQNEVLLKSESGQRMGERLNEKGMSEEIGTNAKVDAEDNEHGREKEHIEAVHINQGEHSQEESLLIEENALQYSQDEEEGKAVVQHEHIPYAQGEELTIQRTAHEESVTQQSSETAIQQHTEKEEM